MKKIICVCGAPLSGKTTYIDIEYTDEEHYHQLDIAKRCLLSDEDYSSIHEDVYCLNNTLFEDGFHALLEGKVLVVEICLNTNTKNRIINISKVARLVGIDIEVIDLKADSDIGERRISSKYDSSYFPSSSLTEPILDVIEEVIDEYGELRKIRLVRKFMQSNKELWLYEAMLDHVQRYFYVDPEQHTWHFGQPNMYELLEAINDIENIIFKSLDEAVSAIQRRTIR